MNGGGSAPAPQASAETWMDMADSFQKGALSDRLGIPIIIGVDAIHGHNNVYNATIFPHNVGLGVTRQVYKICYNASTYRCIYIISFQEIFCSTIYLILMKLCEILSGIQSLLRGLELQLLLKSGLLEFLTLLLLVSR